MVWSYLFYLILHNEIMHKPYSEDRSNKTDKTEISISTSAIIPFGTTKNAKTTQSTNPSKKTSDTTRKFISKIKTQSL